MRAPGHRPVIGRDLTRFRRTARMLVTLLSAALVTAAPLPAAVGGSANADTIGVIQQFLEREEPPLVQYRALRRLEARNERFDNMGWMEACTELQPRGRFGFRVVAEGGSDHMRGRVLRPVLEGEQKAWSSGEVARSGITRRNYRFEPLAGEAVDVVRIGLKPLRRDRMLVDGVMVLTRANGDLIRLDGRLAKNPSFWTTRVQVRRTYARIAGVRVPVMLESVANVRMAGRSTFRMTYDYLAINGRVLDRDQRCAAQAQS